MTELATEIMLSTLGCRKLLWRLLWLITQPICHIRPPRHALAYAQKLLLLFGTNATCFMNLYCWLFLRFFSCCTCFIINRIFICSSNNGIVSVVCAALVACNNCNCNDNLIRTKKTKLPDMQTSLKLRKNKGKNGKKVLMKCIAQNTFGQAVDRIAWRHCTEWNRLVTEVSGQVESSGHIDKLFTRLVVQGASIWPWEKDNVSGFGSWLYNLVTYTSCGKTYKHAMD